MTSMIVFGGRCRAVVAPMYAPIVDAVSSIAAVFTSTRCFLYRCIRPPIVVPMIAVRLAVTASCGGMPASISAGVVRLPPPMPIRLPMAPATVPTARHSAGIVGCKAPLSLSLGWLWGFVAGGFRFIWLGCAWDLLVGVC